MSVWRLRDLVEAAAAHVIGHAEELTDLDRAIGDGDHGVNMSRGCEAVLADLQAISGLPLGEAANLIGRTLVMTIGGASGPLFGTFFMRFGDAVIASATRGEFVEAFDAAVRAVAARGKSKAGEKTMLDVLVPVGDALRACEACSELLRHVRATAHDAAAGTIGMIATKGRASYLGGRSVGHMDPGARSSALIVEAVCLVLERLE